METFFIQFFSFLLHYFLCLFIHSFVFVCSFIRSLRLFASIVCLCTLLFTSFGHSASFVYCLLASLLFVGFLFSDSFPLSSFIFFLFLRPFPSCLCFLCFFHSFFLSFIRCPLFACMLILFLLLPSLHPSLPYYFHSLPLSFHFFKIVIQTPHSKYQSLARFST